MNITAGNIILIGSVLLFVSILAGQRAYKFGVPALVLFLAVGMLAGTDGIGGINFDSPGIAQFIGVIALNFILFSGGLDTEWKSVRPVMWQGVILSTAGVLFTAILTGLFVHWIVPGFSLFEGLLLGSIVSSTDAAAVFSILRSKSLKLKHNLRPILEFESGSNDPMAYLLTIICLGLVMNPEASVSEAIVRFLVQIVVGGGAGILFGIAMVWIARHVKLSYMGLYPVMIIALMYFTYAATDAIGGNGFLAVYLAALWLGNHKIPHRASILSFFDGFAWLMQIILFLTLGLLVFPSQIVPVIGIGLLVSVFMILIARPLSVFASLLFFKMPLNSKLFVSWVGLRGAVPIVFATYPLIAGIDRAGMIFNIVFFISLTSILVQGTTLPLFAKWLKVSEPEEKMIGSKPEIDPSEVSDLIEIRVAEGNAYAGRPVSDAPFPDGARITLLRRGDDHIIVTGSTVLEAGDRLIIASQNRDDAELVYEMLTSADGTRATEN